METPPYTYIYEKLMKQKVIPFLGAGASVCDRNSGSEWTSPEQDFLPKGGELAQYLTDRLVDLNLLDSRSKEDADNVIDLARVAQLFDMLAGSGGLDDELRPIFKKEYIPAVNGIHQFLAEFPTNLLIITTNYDNLLEKAFRDANREVEVVVYNTSNNEFFHYQCNQCENRGDRGNENSIPCKVLPNELDLDLEKTPIIFKMHGTADPQDQEWDSYVITEEHYVEFLSRMVSTTAIPATLMQPLRHSHFLFLGYGLRDWNLRVILHKIWKDWPRKRTSWSIQLGTSALECEFWEKQLVKIYDQKIDDFTRNLRDNH